MYDIYATLHLSTLTPTIMLMTYKKLPSRPRKECYWFSRGILLVRVKCLLFCSSLQTDVYVLNFWYLRSSHTNPKVRVHTLPGGSLDQYDSRVMDRLHPFFFFFSWYLYPELGLQLVFQDHISRPKGYNVLLLSIIINIDRS